MKKIFIFLFTILILTGCSQPQEITEKDKEEAATPTVTFLSIKNNFPKEIISILEKESGGKVSPLMVTRWFPDKNMPGSSSSKDVQENGISISSLQQNKAKDIFKKYYDKFYKDGYLIFLTNLNFDDDRNVIYDLAVIKASDQYKIVKLINTSALNYDITNKQIIEKLKEWGKSIPFRIVVVDNDRIEAEILKMPNNVESFAIKIFDFCPDTVYQGADSLEKLTEGIKKDKYFWLWWD